MANINIRNHQAIANNDSVLYSRSQSALRSRR